jgi:hypothetical protein
VVIAMTQLTYRGCKYIKELEAEKNRQWWNLIHNACKKLQYRGLNYRPIQTGGLIPAPVKAV